MVQAVVVLTSLEMAAQETHQLNLHPKETTAVVMRPEQVFLVQAVVEPGPLVLTLIKQVQPEMEPQAVLEPHHL